MLNDIPNLLYISLLHQDAERKNGIDTLLGLWALAKHGCQEAVPVDYCAPFEDILRRLLLRSRKEHESLGDADSVRDDEVEDLKRFYLDVYLLAILTARC